MMNLAKTFPVTGLPASLPEILVDELVFVLRQYYRRKHACPVEVLLLVPASYRPVSIGLDVDRSALIRDILKASSKICREEMIPLPRHGIYLDVQFDPAVKEIVVRVQQFRPVDASIPPFSGT